MRTEKDSLGEMLIPDEVYYGIDTTRALGNSGILGLKMSEFPKFIWSIAAIKKAAALANADIGVLDPKVASAISAAADEVMSGKHASQFPLNIFQGGGVTPANMNLNEVIANRANEILTGRKGYDRVHPNTDVNKCQSTNDVMPSAVSMALYYFLHDLLKALDPLEDALEAKAAEFSDVVKLGRTCLQDAVPLTLGQEFGGYLSFVRRQRRKIKNVAEDCLELILGGTAVGTGLGTYPGYVDKVYEHLNRITGVPFRGAENLFDGMQSCDLFVDVSGALTSLATGLSRIADIFRLLSSGPRAGLNEIELPAVQPGSSIMPGKINPVMPELLMHVCYQVRGNNHMVLMTVEDGEPDINVWETILAKCLFESCRMLTECIPLFVEKCLKGIKANREVCRKYAESSIALATVVSTLYGYETGTRVAKAAYKENKSVKQVVVEMGILSADEAEKLLDPMLLTDMEKSARLMKTKVG